MTSYDFHERFPTDVQQFLVQLSPPKDKKNGEPSTKRLKFDVASPTIESIRHYLKENAINITPHDETSLNNLANRISELSSFENEEIKLLSLQINNLLKSLSSKFKLTQLPKELIQKILLCLEDHKSAVNLLSSSKFFYSLKDCLKNTSFIAAYLNSFDPHLSLMHERLKGPENAINGKIQWDYPAELTIDFKGCTDHEYELKSLLKAYPFEYVDTLRLLDIKISQATLKMMYPRLKSIKSFTLNNVSVYFSKIVVKDLPKSLQELHLIDCEISFLELFEILNDFPLKRVTFDVSVSGKLPRISDIAKREFNSLFEKLKSLEIEDMSFSLWKYSTSYTSRKKDKKLSLWSAYFIKKLFVKGKFSSLKSFTTDIVLTDAGVQRLIESKHVLESIELDIGNWSFLIELLAKSPKGERIQKLFLNSRSHQAIENLAKSSYLKNIKQLIVRAENNEGPLLSQDLHLINQAISDLAKSSNLNSVETLDITKASIEDDNENPYSFEPDFSPLFDEDGMKNLKHLIVSENSSLWPKNLSNVFDKERFPTFESVQVQRRFLSSFNISSAEELNLFIANEEF